VVCEYHKYDVKNSEKLLSFNAVVSCEERLVLWHKSVCNLDWLATYGRYKYSTCKYVLIEFISQFIETFETFMGPALFAFYRKCHGQVRVEKIAVFWLCLKTHAFLLIIH